MNTVTNTYTSYNGIPFETQWDLGTIPSELGTILEGKMRFDSFSHINFLKVSGQFLAAKFSDISEADRYQAALERHFKPKERSWNSEPNSDGTQNLKYAGRCEYNGRYYVLAQTCNKLDEDNMNEVKGLWKGVVLNPGLYFSDSTQVQADNGAGEVGRILDKRN